MTSDMSMEPRPESRQPDQDAPLPPDHTAQVATPSRSSISAVEQPGCIAFFVIPSAIISTIAAGFGALYGFSLLIEGDVSEGVLALSVSIGAVSLYLIFVRGLWKMRNWARLLVLVFSGTGLVGSAITLCVSLSGDAGAAGVISGLLGLIVPGSIFYWFYVSDYLFS